MTERTNIIQCEIDGDFDHIDLVFSIDVGKTWSHCEMNRENRLYSALLPLMPADTEVRYYFEGLTLDNQLVSQGSPDQYYSVKYGPSRVPLSRKPIPSPPPIEEPESDVNPDESETVNQSTESDVSKDDDFKEDDFEPTPTKPEEQNNPPIVQHPHNAPRIASPFGTGGGMGMGPSGFPFPKTGPLSQDAVKKYFEARNIDPAQVVQNMIKIRSVPPDLKDLVIEKPVNSKDPEFLRIYRLGKEGVKTKEEITATEQQMAPMIPMYAGPVQELMDFAKPCLQQDRIAEALELYKFCVQMDPAEEMLWNELMRAYFINQDLKAASRCCDYILLLNPNDKHGKMMEQYLADEGNALLQDKANFYYIIFSQGGIATAERLLMDLLQADPSKKEKIVAVFSSMATLFRKQNIYDKALKYYQKAIQIDPNFSPAWNSLGNYYADKNQIEEAKKAYETAAKLDPKSPDPWNNYGNMMHNHGDLETAKHYYDKALQINPEHPLANRNTADYYFDKGKKKEAIRFYQKTLQIDPNDAHAREQIDVLENPNASQNSPTSTRMPPELQDPKKLGEMGKVACVLNQLDVAEQLLTQAVQVDPKSHENWFFLGRTLFMKGQRDKARDCFQRILSDQLQAPKEFMGDVYNQLGLIAQLQKDFQTAFDFFEKAYKCLPKLEQLPFCLGIAAAYSDHEKDAKKWLSQVIGHSKVLQERQIAEDILNRLKHQQPLPEFEFN